MRCAEEPAGRRKESKPLRRSEAAAVSGLLAEVALFLLRLNRNKLTSVDFYRNKIIPAEDFLFSLHQKAAAI